MSDETSTGVNISGGQFVAGNIGGKGNTGSVSGPVTFGSAAPDEVRAALAALRTELERLRAEISCSEADTIDTEDIDDVIAEATSDHPDPVLVVRRWRQVAALIPASLRGLETVSKVVALIEHIRTLAD